MATVSRCAPVRHGTCYLRVVINRCEYSCRPVPRVDLPAGVRRGFRLVRLDTGARYFVLRQEGTNQCSCPDVAHRAARCKHQRALEAPGLLSPRRRRPSEKGGAL